MAETQSPDTRNLPTREPVESVCRVTVPEKDLFGEDGLIFRINDMSFYPGKTYMLPEPVAIELKRLIASRQKYDMRILQPTRDVEALRRVAGIHPGVTEDKTSSG